MENLSTSFNSEARVNRPEQIALDLLENNRGLFIGDIHLISRDSSNLAITIMADAKEAGVDFIFLEHFYTKDQDVLDLYSETRDRDIIYDRYRENIGFSKENMSPLQEDIMRHEVDRILGVVNAANRSGIKAMAMDDIAFSGAIGERRLEVDSLWADHINQIVPSGSKFLILAGNYHSNEQGIDTILGIPSMDSVPNDSTLYHQDVVPESEYAGGNNNLKADFAFRFER